MTGRYLAFVGGTETYGKFIPRPFPTLVEEAVGTPCVNFGCVNASIGAFCAEVAVQQACRDSALNVLQIMGAANLSNRFYQVHPRRNDRFVSASSVLRAIYPDVDFAEFCFVGHMLGTLYDRSPERFAILRSELQLAWRVRMMEFIETAGRHTLLLWISDRMPSDLNQDSHPLAPRSEPLFVTRSMVDDLRPHVLGVVAVPRSPRAQLLGTQGMVFPEMAAAAAAELPNPATHEDVAQALTGAIRTALGFA